jgi:hypothetical protein
MCVFVAAQCSVLELQLEKKEIPDDVSWIHSLPSPGGPKQYLGPDRTVGHIKKVFNTSTSYRSEKESLLNVLLLS